MCSKKWIILLSVVAVLVIIRLILPVAVKNIANKTLRDLDGYKGHVQDIDINFLRGVYAIDSITIINTGEDSLPVSFVVVPRIDFSVDWGTLFKGAIVGEVIIREPQVNFAVGFEEKAKQKIEQYGPDTNWVEKIKSLMPLKLNRFEIINGTVSYRDFTTKPELNLFITGLNAVATNLSNVEKSENSLPSTIEISGKSLGDGLLNIYANVNVLKEIPDIDLSLKFEDIKLSAFNDFFRTYTKTDIERGTINLYSEIAVDDSNIGGYLKVIIDNLKTAKWSEEEGKFFQKVWESTVGGITEILENQKQDQLATDVPIKGRVENADIGIMPAIWEVLKNAFIEALEKGLKNSVTFPESANQQKPGKENEGR